MRRTKAERIDALAIGQQVTLTVQSGATGREEITGTVESLTPHAVRVRTCDSCISVGRTHGYILDLKVHGRR